MIQTNAFGNICKESIETITSGEVSEIRTRLFKMTRTRECDQKVFQETVNEYRQAVGALYIRLSQNVNKDTQYAYKVSDSLWNSMWVALVEHSLPPQKYFRPCGLEGYGGASTFLANVQTQNEEWRRWGFSSCDEAVQKIWATKTNLLEKEKEFRNAALAVNQIGVGMGGMIIGIIAFFVSIIVSIIGFCIR